jgi:hypothetical protein
VIIGTSLYGALMFARMYGSGDVTAKHMMMIAITCVDKIKPKEPEPPLVEIDEGAGAYILEPFAQQVIREATKAAERAAAHAIGKATRQEPRELHLVLGNVVSARMKFCSPPS